jgi:hypothetical protein
MVADFLCRKTLLSSALSQVRADLLAHVAGVLEGFSEGQLDEPLARQAAGLCRAAGADPDSIPGMDRRGATTEGRSEHAADVRWPACRGSAAVLAAAVRF